MSDVVSLSRYNFICDKNKFLYQVCFDDNTELYALEAGLSIKEWGSRSKKPIKPPTKVQQYFISTCVKDGVLIYPIADKSPTVLLSLLYGYHCGFASVIDVYSKKDISCLPFSIDTMRLYALDYNNKSVVMELFILREENKRLRAILDKVKNVLGEYNI